MNIILTFFLGITIGIIIGVAYCKNWIIIMYNYTKRIFVTIITKSKIFIVKIIRIIYDKFKTIKNSFKFSNFYNSKSDNDIYSKTKSASNEMIKIVIPLIVLPIFLFFATSLVQIFSVAFGPALSYFVNMKIFQTPTPPKTLPSLVAEKSDIVEFYPIGEKLIGKTKGSYYQLKLKIEGELKNFYKNGNILFPKEEFFIKNFTSNSSYFQIWGALSEILNSISIKRKSVNQYIFIKGSADSAKISNEDNFTEIANLTYSEYFEKWSKEITSYLSQDIYYFQMSKSFEENIEDKLTEISEPKSFTITGYCNSDLPFLRAMFIRSVLLTNSVNELALPIGIIKGEIIDTEDPEYRTVSLFLFETDKDLKKELHNESIDFDKYFKYKEKSVFPIIKEQENNNIDKNENNYVFNLILIVIAASILIAFFVFMRNRTKN